MGFFTKSGDSKDAGILGAYKLGKTLGSGAFADVKLGTAKKDGEKVAVKIIKRNALSTSETEALETEVSVLESLTHPNIVGLKCVFDTPKTFYMVMELCQGGELFDRVVEKDHYSEKEAARAVIAVARALQHCHHHDIVHRDLKPENLLYFEPPPSLETLKLADFGLAHLLEPGASLRTACGTPGYVAPEIVKNLPYNSAVDMWSLGIVLYILLCGFPPFYDDNTAVLFDTIARGVYEFTPPYWDAVSDEAKAVVSKLMCADPKKRLTADQLLAEPWVKGEGTPDTALPGFQEQLGKYNAKRKFKNVIMQGQIVNFLQKSAKVTNALAAKVAKAKAAAAETAAAA